MWHANAPWTATGYGQQSRLFLPYVAGRYDTAISQNHGYAGAMTEWEGLKVYPEGFDAYGNDVIPSWAMDHMTPDEGWVVGLYDGWVFKNPAFSKFHMAVWAPVDHEPLPPITASAFRDLNMLPVAMSRFGQKQFEQAGLEALYSPHAVDPAFKPGATSRLDLPDDAFVVGMNANNKAAGSFHRKGFGEAFHAFSLFAKQHPDAVLWVHAEATGIAQGWDLETLAAGFGISDRVEFTNQFNYRLGLSTEWLADWYNALDVYLSPSYGEGFGIPIVEAQACGVPVVVTDFTAMSELVGDGWKVPGQIVWHEKQQSFWKIPNVGQIVDALSEAYERPRGSSEKAVKFASRFYPDRVWEDYLGPVFDELEERIDPKAVAA